MADLTTEDLCRIMHYALQRETRVHGERPTDLDLDMSTGWDDSAPEYKAVIRGSVMAVELVARKDERARYRNELMQCMADLAMNPRPGD